MCFFFYFLVAGAEGSPGEPLPDRSAILLIFISLGPLLTRKEWAKAVDEGYRIDSAPLDFYRAFDRVSHKKPTS